MATILVSNLVVGETYTWLRKKPGYNKALLFLKVIAEKNELNQLKIIYSEPGSCNFISTASCSIRTLYSNMSRISA
jgi:hypothetical protein